MSQKLTPVIIAGMLPGQELADEDAPGLRIRCGATGKKTFFYRYRASSGALRQIKLGEFPPSGSMTLAGARKALAEKKTEREKGIDPQGKKQAEKVAAKAQREKERVAAYTVADMIDDYLAWHVVPMRKPKGAAEVTRFLSSSDLQALRKRPALDVKRKEAAELIKSIRLRAPVLAGQIKQELRAAYEHALNDGRLDMAGNPFAFDITGVTPVPRDRFLSNSELVQLVPWMRREYSETVADALLISLYTGTRTGEVCELEAREIEETPGGMVWTIPKQKAKNKVAFRVMVPETAALIIRKRLSMYPNGFLFPSRKAGEPIKQKVLGVEVWIHSSSCKHLRHDSKSKCPVDGWAPHDMRRTCRTKLSELRCPMEVAEAILNHAKGGTRANYDHYQFDAEKREWLKRWADYLDALLTADNLVPMQSKTAA